MSVLLPVNSQGVAFVISKAPPYVEVDRLDGLFLRIAEVFNLRDLLWCLADLGPGCLCGPLAVGCSLSAHICKLGLSLPTVWCSVGI